MKLISEEFEELFKDYPLYSQEHEKDPLVIAKLFDPCGSATWYLTEYDPAEKIAFGWVQGAADFLWQPLDDEGGRSSGDNNINASQNRVHLYATIGFNF